MVSGRWMCALAFATGLQATALHAAGTPARPPDAPQIRPEDGTVASLRRGDAYAHLVAAGLAISRGHGSEAVSELDLATALEPNAPGLLAQGASILAVLGRRAEAEKLMTEGPTLYPNHGGPTQHALAFAGLGDKDRTIEQLERMVSLGPVRLGRELTTPEFALVRGDPRVKVLRKKVGLPE